MERPKMYSWIRLVRYLARQETMALVHTKLNFVLSFVFYFMARLAFSSGNRERAVYFALKSRRISSFKLNNRFIHHLMQKTWITDVLFSLLPESNSSASIDALQDRIIVLSAPIFNGQRLTSKGVLIVKFSETFGLLARQADLKQLTDNFHVVLEPSWVGYSLPEILIWSKLTGSNAVFIMAAYHQDFSFIESLNGNLIPCTIGPADWVNSNTFKPGNSTTFRYDSVYLANYDKMKRVDRYLRAVVNLTKKYPNYKAILVCAGHGDSHSDLNNAIAWAIAKSNLEFKTGLSQVELAEIVRQSKVNALFSLREGANKGLAEGLWCNTPALLLKDCVCGNHRHINTSTGKSVSDSEIETALESFYLNHIETSPRNWVEQNISPSKSTDKLLDVIEANSKIPVTKPLLVKTNTPELNYLDTRFLPLLGQRAMLLNAVSIRNNKEGKIVQAAASWSNELSEIYSESLSTS